MGAGAPRVEGSWWTAWHTWLLAQGRGHRVKARVPDGALPDAPGTNVLVRYFD